MEGKELEKLLRQMLSDLQRLSNKAGQLRQSLKQVDQIDYRIMELQHAIARIAHHNRVDRHRIISSGTPTYTEGVTQFLQRRLRYTVEWLTSFGSGADRRQVETGLPVRCAQP